ncbi:hypothetical protein CCR91_00695 [Thiorhodovibrio winogradskyi]|nr:hypothetical protein [Thiorhodovibrio winogradskyi]
MRPDGLEHFTQAVRPSTEYHVQREARSEADKAQDIKRWQADKRTDKAVSHAEVEKWLNSREKRANHLTR